MCPSVTRYYSVVGALPDLYQQARGALAEAGFGDIQDTRPSCDLLTNAAPCSITATRDGVRIEVYVFPADQDVDALGIAVPGQPTVRIVAR